MATMIEGDIRDTALVEQLLRDCDITGVIHFSLKVTSTEPSLVPLG